MRHTGKDPGSLFISDRGSLRAALASPDTKSPYVRRLFATIADRYDFITVLLSGGLDRRWKRRLADLARIIPGEQALDLACGTGDISFEVSGRGARVTGLDLTPRMIEIATLRRGRASRPAFLVGDMMRLPFPAASFDLVTAGYGIRNVPVIEPALREILRVLKPGGRFLSLDFNRPESAPIRFAYLSYLTVVGSVVGYALHRDPDTYRYIPESIRRYPGARAIAGLMRHVGFAQADHVRVLGGLMAIHRAAK